MSNLVTRQPKISTICISKKAENSLGRKTSFDNPAPSFSSGFKGNINVTNGNIHYLQRTIGNQAVGKIIQAKMKIGRPGDLYEKEADRMADKVTSMSGTKVQYLPDKEGTEVNTKLLADQITPLIQKQSEERKEETVQTKTLLQCQEEEKEVQAKSEEEKQEASQPKLQRQEEEIEAQTQPEKEKEETARAKFLVQPQEEEKEVQTQAEKEKEETAQAKFLVQRREEEREVQTQPNEEKEEPVQTKTLLQYQEDEKEVQTQAEEEKEETGQLKISVQRQEEEEEVQAQFNKEKEEPSRAKLLAQRQGEEDEDQAMSEVKNYDNVRHIFNTTDNQFTISKGGGHPLPDETRTFMELRFGSDFSGVKIHTDSSATQMTKEMNAQAFTRGEDIYFNEGKFDPATSKGKLLLAHELTHTIQQGAAPQIKQMTKKQSVNEQTEKDSSEIKDSNTEATNLVNPNPINKTTEETEENRPKKVVPNNIKGFSENSVEKLEKKTPRKEIEKSQNASKAVVSEGIAIESKTTTGKEEATKVKTMALEGKSEDIMRSFMEAKPSQIASTYPSLGSTVADKLNQEQKETAESVPQLKVQIGGVKELPFREGKEVKSESTEIDKGVTGPELPKPEVKEQKHVGELPNKKLIDKQLDKVEQGGNQFKSLIGNVATSDPGLDTSAGERPEMDLSGRADLNRIENQKSEGTQRADDKKNETVKAIIDNPGKENIQPIEVDEEKKLEVKKEAATAIETKDDQGMKDYVDLTFPPDMREAADNKLKPLTEKSLAKQREEITTAARKRDDDKTAEMKRAEEETAKLNKDAEEDQNDIVTKSRSDVNKKQEEGMKEAKDKQVEFEKEANEEQTSQNEKIGSRIKDDKEKMDKKLSEAEKEAQKEKEKGEKEAFEKKKELEKNSEKSSWWDRAVNAVKAAVKAVTDAIDKVFDAVRQVVKSIIDAAKNAVLAVIEAGRKWVVEQLDKFGKWIKDKVNKYIGSVFPGIAQKINTLIDATVDKTKKAVNFIADKLKKGVEELANAVTNAINSILNKFQTAMKAAVQIAGALLTGDFAEALKIAFLAVCEMAGIDPKPILDFLSYAGDTIKIIYKDPLQFFLNVVNGIKKGLNQFIGNIKKHLLNGLIGWLTGAISEAGITLPENFDLKGIFSLVMQILGLTYQNIRAKVVKKLGPNGEEIVSKLEATVSFIKDLVTRGPIVLWEKVKEKLTDLKETVIGGIRDWVISTVIKEGVIWLISLLNPASAIVKALKLLYDIVMFFVERYQQIVDFVKSVFESVGALARGSLNKAANAVEGALGRSVPVIISFMASLLGLGGIGKTIKKIIEKVRKPIDQALDKIISWIVEKGKGLLKKGKGSFKKGKAAVKKGIKKLKEIFFPKLTLKTGKEVHNAEVVLSGNTYKILLHSKEDKTVPGFIQYAKKEGYKPVNNLEKIKQSYNSWLKLPSQKEEQRTEKGNKYREIIKEIEKIWSNLPTADDIEVSKITWTTDAEGRSEKVEANPLTVKGIEGSPPRETIPGYSPTVTDQKGEKVACIKAHLLHHLLHGPGRKFNMTPTSRRINALMLSKVESNVLNALGIRPLNKVFQKTRKAKFTTTIVYKDKPPDPLLKNVAQIVHMNSSVSDIKTGPVDSWSLSEDNYK